MFFRRHKKETMDVYLPFRLIPADDGGVDIEAYGSVCCVQIYVTSSFMYTDNVLYEDGTLTRTYEMLRHPENRRVKVTVTIKDDKPIDGKIDAASLAEIYNDDCFLKLELGGWGLFEDSVYEKVMRERQKQ